MSFNPYANGATVADVGLTANPATTQNPDGNYQPVLLGRQTEQVVAELGGRNRIMSHRGGVYIAAATTAAIAIPINTTTSGSTFCLLNPIGSPVVLEPIDFQLDFLMTNAAPATATVVGFSFVNTNVNLASSITKIAVPTGGTVAASGAFGGRLDQAANNGYVASAITFASALTVAANWGYPIASFPASWVPTVGGYPVVFAHDFKGKLLLPPGYAMTLTASTAWGSTTTVPSISWAEYLI